MANHVCASEEWGVVDTNADAIRALAAHGVVEPAVAPAVGFRNILVHQYLEVDDDRVVAMLREPGDLDRHVKQVMRWLEQKSR